MVNFMINNTKFVQTSGLGAKQRGAVLLVAMIMLLLLTMFGVGIMETSSTQLKITTGLKNMSTALNAAENAIVVAERRVKKIVDDDTIEVFSDTYFDVRGTYSAASLDSVAEGTAAIEYLGFQRFDREETRGAHIFRITLKNSASDGTTRTIQTIYTVEPEPES
jgi:Tfp pilus assembly protein PilX